MERKKCLCILLIFIVSCFVMILSTKLFQSVILIRKDLFQKVCFEQFDKNSEEGYTDI